MNTGKAIFYGLALIALAIFARDVMKPANAGLMGSGKFMGVSGGGGSVWVVNTDTGATRQCINSGCLKWFGK